MHSAVSKILDLVQEGKEVIAEGLLQTFHDDIYDQAFDNGFEAARYEDNNIGMSVEGPMDLVDAAALMAKGHIIG